MARGLARCVRVQGATRPAAPCSDSSLTPALLSSYGVQDGGGNLALTPGVPTQIGMLSNLVILNLNHCGFSGTIPTEVGSFSILNHFLLRGTTLGMEAVTNRFSGPVQARYVRIVVSGWHGHVSMRTGVVVFVARGGCGLPHLCPGGILSLL